MEYLDLFRKHAIFRIWVCCLSIWVCSGKLTVLPYPRATRLIGENLNFNVSSNSNDSFITISFQSKGTKQNVTLYDSKENKFYQENSRYKIVFFSKIRFDLVISPVNLADSGKFIFSEMVGSMNVETVTVNVSVSNATIRAPENVIKKEASYVTLTVIFNAKSCDSLEWDYTEESKFVPLYRIYMGFAPEYAGRSTIVNSTDGGRCMSVVNITGLKLTDSGEFSVGGYQAESSFKKYFTLMVVGGYPEKCSISDVTKGDVIENQDMKIDCSIQYTGAQPYELSIQQVSSDIPTVNQLQSRDSISYSFTALPPTIPQYQCSLKFDFSSAKADEATNNPILQICATDQLPVMYPVRNIRIDPPGARYRPGLELTCLADGYPFPEIWWEESGKKMPSGPKLIVPKTTDYTYKCVAQNSMRGVMYTSNTSEILLTDQSTAQESSSNTGLIVGLVVGLVLGGLLIAVLIILGWRYHKHLSPFKGRSPRSEKEAEPLTQFEPPPPTGKNIYTGPKMPPPRPSPDGQSAPSKFKDDPEGPVPLPRGSRKSTENLDNAMPTTKVPQPAMRPSRSTENLTRSNENLAKKDDEPEVLYADLAKDSNPGPHTKKKPARKKEEATLYAVPDRA